jgi:hypothetical protein
MPNGIFEAEITFQPTSQIACHQILNSIFLLSSAKVLLTQKKITKSEFF